LERSAGAIAKAQFQRFILSDCLIWLIAGARGSSATPALLNVPPGCIGTAAKFAGLIGGDEPGGRGQL
jgi:hypothetical protein